MEQHDPETDSLTGNLWVSERLMYMRYHGLTKIQANEVMSLKTYAERDALCDRFIRRNAGQQVI